MSRISNLVTRYKHTFTGNLLRRQRDPGLAIGQVIVAPTTRFLVLHHDRPLMVVYQDKQHKRHMLAWQTLDFLSQYDLDYNNHAALLGYSESDLSNKLRNDDEGRSVNSDARHGCVAVDMSSVSQEDILSKAGCPSNGTLEFASIRSSVATCDGEDMALISQAKALLDWIRKCLYCSVCGSSTVSLEAGIRRGCSQCTASFYPRTDPVIICCVLSHDRERMLLGRYTRSLPGVYTALAGFIEQGESIEEAVQREVWEESGIRVEEVIYHSSQPFPLGPGGTNQLMIGCMAIAQAESHEVIIDKSEMEDIRWFSQPEVHQAISRFQPDPVTLWFPPSQYIAHHLIASGLTMMPKRSSM